MLFATKGTQSPHVSRTEESESRCVVALLVENRDCHGTRGSMYEWDALFPWPAVEGGMG